MMRILSIATLLFFYACSNNKPEQKQEEKVEPVISKYYFYPKANLYFDSTKKEYIFLASDNKTWQTVPQIPAAMQAMLDKGVFIDTPSTPVWRDNERHKMIYAAVLYASPTDTQMIKPVPQVKEPPKEEKKEKKGLAKFIDKIFGKKKKDTTRSS